MFNSDQKFKLGVVGAAGVIGEEIVRVLFLREFPVAALKLFESGDRIGDEIEFGSTQVPVETLSDSGLDSLDAVIFSTPETVSAEWVPIAKSLGLRVIDFAQPPLIGETAQIDKGIPGGVIHLPSAVSVIVAPTLRCLQRSGFRIERVRITGLLAVSEAGRLGISALSDGTRTLLGMGTIEDSPFGGRLAFNVVPGAGSAAGLEERVNLELSELVSIERVRISSMLAYVPVFYGHTIAIEVETSPRLPAEKAFQLFKEDDLLEPSGITVNDPASPMVSELAGTDEIGIGRIKSTATGLQFWVAADNIRPVANMAVRILEQSLGLENS